jgi:hypothetical protein
MNEDSYTLQSRIPFLSVFLFNWMQRSEALLYFQEVEINLLDLAAFHVSSEISQISTSISGCKVNLLYHDIILPEVNHSFFETRIP